MSIVRVGVVRVLTGRVLRNDASDYAVTSLSSPNWIGLG